MTATATAYVPKSKAQRIAELRKVRDMALHGSLATTHPDLKRTCATASKVLSQEIGRIAMMEDEKEIRGVLDRVIGYATTVFGREVRRLEAEARRVGVADAPCLLAMACSDT